MNGSRPSRESSISQDWNNVIRDEGSYTSFDGQLIIGSHVDDLIGIALTEANLDKAERSVEKYIELDKRGRPSQILGIELSWSKEGVILTQKSLIEMIERTHLVQENGKAGGRHSLPLNPERYATSTDNQDLTEQKPYQALVGGLLFIARMTRPEISVHINLLGRRATQPSAANWKVALQILEYLCSTKDEGIILRKGRSLELKAYADASYGGMEARSQTGVLLTQEINR